MSQGDSTLLLPRVEDPKPFAMLGLLLSFIAAILGLLSVSFSEEPASTSELRAVMATYTAGPGTQRKSTTLAPVTGVRFVSAPKQAGPSEQLGSRLGAQAGNVRSMEVKASTNQEGHVAADSTPADTTRSWGPSFMTLSLMSVGASVLAFWKHFSQPAEKSNLDQIEDPESNVFAKGAQNMAATAAAVAISLASPNEALARLEPVNRPDLLPKGEVTNVIDVAKYLTSGETEYIQKLTQNLEATQGVKLRVLIQNYPETPGLAVKDYWNVDDDTIVFVADPTFKNILNFNVGQDIDLMAPKNFWSRLSGKFGTEKYWKENGEETSILNAVTAIDNCMRDPTGTCREVDAEMGSYRGDGPKGGLFNF